MQKVVDGNMQERLINEQNNLYNDLMYKKQEHPIDQPKPSSQSQTSQDKQPINNKLKFSKIQQNIQNIKEISTQNKLKQKNQTVNFGKNSIVNKSKSPLNKQKQNHLYSAKQIDIKSPNLRSKQKFHTQIQQTENQFSKNSQRTISQSNYNSHIKIGINENKKQNINLEKTNQSSQIFSQNHQSIVTPITQSSNNISSNTSFISHNQINNNNINNNLFQNIEQIKRCENTEYSDNQSQKSPINSQTIQINGFSNNQHYYNQNISQNKNINQQNSIDIQNQIQNLIPKNQSKLSQQLKQSYEGEDFFSSQSRIQHPNQNKFNIEQSHLKQKQQEDMFKQQLANDWNSNQFFASEQDDKISDQNNYISIKNEDFNNGQKNNCNSLLNQIPPMQRSVSGFISQSGSKQIEENKNYPNDKVNEQIGNINYDSKQNKILTPQLKNSNTQIKSIQNQKVNFIQQKSKTPNLKMNTVNSHSTPLTLKQWQQQQDRLLFKNKNDFFTNKKIQTFEEVMKKLSQNNKI
ncbi:hypothetical protein PPERSA_00899 [Pseudocohnilembus persalinus]|uniref:Uncharacterized protein n=1 Tax=Pseudocohnilembus persalinus TaxID=266149 RepID=A0A0V0QEW9_PSEPJ|nr:hypothetical protein PPERSA_00899 [Pseudocohnilembus persalinus]|eukprot:KRX00672.1 hypothetical protein PPERSA_00899 [Pseudocohnilembus persalinus]